MKLLHYSLDHFREGLLFFYFSSIDQGSHMLWGKHEPALLEIYRAVDAAIGDAERRFPRADIIVMSDHGFNSFDRSVNLNTWLWEKGFLALRGSPRGGDEGFADVDWTKTQAYALGLNGLYLNVAGRGRRTRHSAARDGNRSSDREAGARAGGVSRSAERTAGGGDSSGYRRATGSGHDRGLWTRVSRIVGDRIGRGAAGDSGGQYGRVDRRRPLHQRLADVPGVLVSNRAPRAASPSLKDVTVSILGIFGLGAGEGMQGKSVFE